MAALAARDVDGERQSNTRLVRWSDGSMTLHVGSEVLSATSQPLGKRGAGQEATGAPAARCVKGLVEFVGGGIMLRMDELLLF